MKRYPELAHQAANDPEIAELKYKAIDKLSAAYLLVGMINRIEENSVDETEREEQLMEYMEDAGYSFRSYLRAKLKKYKQLLEQNNLEQQDIINHGNEKIKQHLEDLLELKQKRGLQ